MKVKVKNHPADIKNPNTGTPGRNVTYKKRSDNTSNQRNPNNKNYQGKKK